MSQHVFTLPASACTNPAHTAYKLSCVGSQWTHHNFLAHNLIAHLDHLGALQHVLELRHQ